VQRDPRDRPRKTSKILIETVVPTLTAMMLSQPENYDDGASDGPHHL
jgi:hypothetical protein